MNKPVIVFVLAAGLGERLRPITNHIPKPLLPVLGRPVLELVLEKVSPFVNTIGINLHHKKELIAEYINNSSFKEQVAIFYEEPILGTGGALKNAEGLLAKGTFLVHNADILSDIDLERLIEFHLSSGNIATLAVHDYKQFNNLEIDDNGFLKGVNIHIHKPTQYAADSPAANPLPLKASHPDGLLAGESAENIKAFTGVAVYEPEFLNFLPHGVSSVTDAWMRAKDAGNKIGIMDVSGAYWTDIGNPSAYASAVVNALRSSGETIYIHPDIECGDVEMDGYVVIEKGCALSDVKSLRNCIILSAFPSPQSSPQKGEEVNKSPLPSGERARVRGFSFENCIICRDIQIDLNESEMLGFEKGEDPCLRHAGASILIGVGGSDRRYYRRKNSAQSEVLVRYAKLVPAGFKQGNDADFHRHIEYTKFFRKHNIPVPELIDVDYENRTAVFEDLGDLSLYSWLKCRRGKGQIEEMYRRVLNILVELHTTVTSHISELPLLQERVFDYEHARWETDYFMEQFVKNIKGIDIKNIPALTDEFHKLAKKTDSFAKTIIHRDFQSQNIMVKKGIPRLIDYQGARIGPPAYDAASILWDPYFRLDDSDRKTLLEYYIQQMKKKSGEKFKETDFIESMTVCCLQRHMQALGAYGFLSSVKGKKYFLKHIPEGLNLLKKDIMPLRPKYPSLYELVMMF